MGDYQPVDPSARMQALSGNPQVAKGMEAFEGQAKKFGGAWKLLFFLCGTCATVAGVLSIVVGIMNFSPLFDFFNFIFLALFGLIMMIVDIPLDNMYIRNFRYAIFHYALFMTRFMGRGFWYIFLGSMTFGALWDMNICPWLGFFMGFAMLGVAVASLFYGWRLTSKLEDVRTKVVEQGPEKWGAYIPPRGMTKVQFKEMAVALKGTVFSDEELSYIVAAFSFEVKSDDIISRDEFEEWCRGPNRTIL